MKTLIFLLKVFELLLSNILIIQKINHEKIKLQIPQLTNKGMAALIMLNFLTVLKKINLVLIILKDLI